MGLFRVEIDSCINVYPHYGEHKRIKNNTCHDKWVEILIFNNSDAELAYGTRCIYLSIWLQFIAFQLNKYPLFLEVAQFEIAVNFFFFFFERINDYLDEQICNEKWAENHVHDKDVLVHLIFSSLWF